MDGPHDVARAYYSEKLRQHGATARGVDWPSAASQYLRFAQLLKICDFGSPFSLNDFGCGYGALLEYLAFRHPTTAIDYRGVDISPAMIEAARLIWSKSQQATFSIGRACPGAADYSIASGVFNIRLGWPVDGWEAYVGSILSDLRHSSRIGFSVNFLAPLENEDDSRRQALYRTLPARWIAFLSTELGCAATAISDYGLREFTLLVRIPGAGEPRPRSDATQGRVAPAEHGLP